MDAKLRKKIEGHGAIHSIGLRAFVDEMGREPTLLRELLTFLEGTNADRREIETCRRLAQRYKPGRG
jgi:hypothetical protein